MYCIVSFWLKNGQPFCTPFWCNGSYTVSVTFPQGTGVLAAVWSLHHDPAFWDDPWKFDPERFAPENRDKIIEMTYMPFGDGPR